MSEQSDLSPSPAAFLAEIDTFRALSSSIALDEVETAAAGS